MQALKKLVTATTAAVALSAGAASAQTVTLFQAGGIDAGSFSVSIDSTARTVVINETWTSAAPAYLRFSGLGGSSWGITKNITNNTGNTWTRFANELLDPLSQANDDSLDPLPYPGFVPPGWSTSNDNDGLTFSGTRASNVFSSVFIDENTDARDFMDFFNGPLANGGSGNLTFRLFGPNSGEDFLLVQRPNEFSSVIPVPGALPLLASGLLAFGWMARRRKA